MVRSKLTRNDTAKAKVGALSQGLAPKGRNKPRRIVQSRGSDLTNVFKEYTHKLGSSEASAFQPGYCRIFPIDGLGNTFSVVNGLWPKANSWRSDIWIDCSLYDPRRELLNLASALKEAAEDISTGGRLRSGLRKWLAVALLRLRHQIRESYALEGDINWDAQHSFTGTRKSVGRSPTQEWPKFYVALDVAFGRAVGEKRVGSINKAMRDWAMSEDTIKKSLTEWSGAARRVVKRILSLEAQFGIGSQQSASDYRKALRTCAKVTKSPFNYIHPWERKT